MTKLFKTDDTSYLARNWVELHELAVDTGEEARFPYPCVTYDELVKICAWHASTNPDNRASSQILTLIYRRELPPIMLPPTPEAPLGSIEWGDSLEVLLPTTDLHSRLSSIFERLCAHPIDPTPVTVLPVFDVDSVTAWHLLKWKQDLQVLLGRYDRYLDPYLFTSFFDRVVLLARSKRCAIAAKKHLSDFDGGVIPAKAEATIIQEFDKLRIRLRLFPSSIYAARIITRYYGEVVPWPKIEDDLRDDDFVLVAGPPDLVDEAVKRLWWSTW